MAKKKSSEHDEHAQDNEHDDSLVVVDGGEPTEIGDRLAGLTNAVDMLSYKMGSLASYNELVDCLAALAAGSFDVVESLLPKLSFGVQKDIEAICAGLKQSVDKRPAAVVAAERGNDVGVPRVLAGDEFPDWLGKVADALADADYELSVRTIAVLNNGAYVIGPEHGKKLPFELVLAVQEAGAAIELVGNYYVVSAK